MRVALPSNNKLIVDICQPKFSLIRELCDINGSILIKNHLVSRCVNINIDNITVCDRDYLFFLCLTSLLNGEFEVNCKCSCGENAKIKVPADSLNVYDIVPGMDVKASVWSKLKYYTFKILTVKEEMECVNRSLSWEGYSSDLIVDLRAAKTIRNKNFDYSSKEAFYKSIGKCSLKAFSIAADFDRIAFHGVLTIAQHVCKKCGKEMTVPFFLDGESAKISLESITKAYARVSSKMSYQDFLDMTLPEFTNFISALNDENK